MFSFKNINFSSILTVVVALLGAAAGHSNVTKAAQGIESAVDALDATVDNLAKQQ